jgi:hypothetical protein
VYCLSQRAKLPALGRWHVVGGTKTARLLCPKALRNDPRSAEEVYSPKLVEGEFSGQFRKVNSRKLLVTTRKSFLLIG